MTEENQDLEAKTITELQPKLNAPPPLSWSDYDEEDQAEIRAIEKRLSFLILEPPVFTSLEDIDNLTYDQAIEVIKAARRKLMINLIGLETHEHWYDDCGDDTQIASENWEYLHNLYFGSDGDEATVINGVREWLDPRNQTKEDYPDTWGGVDGEIRFMLLGDHLVQQVHDEQDRLHAEWRESAAGQEFQRYLDQSRNTPHLTLPEFRAYEAEQKKGSSS